MIEVRDLTKTYTSGQGELTVLKQLNFRVKSGEFVAIIGKSGSGKSTLLYQMSLLDCPTGGAIMIDGLETCRMSEEDRVRYRLAEFGFVFQEYALIPSLTALENVMAPILMRSVSFVHAQSRARESLTRVGLADRAENLPSQLSGGQQQRVSIARAIANRPKILYADEPTANLDTATSKTVLEIFKDLHKKGQTIIMVTHEMEYAKMAQRIITLSDGMIVDDSQKKKRV